MIGREAYSLYVERPTEGAGLPQMGPFQQPAGQVRPVDHRAILARCAPPARSPILPCPIS
jgi:hypothetical protein